MSVVCKICNEIQKSYMGLSKHIKFKHGLTSEDYYLSHINKTSGRCIVCSKPVKFKNIQLGYNSTCSHKCGCIYTRERLRQNYNKFNEFRDRVSKHRKEWWSSLSDEQRLKQIEKSKSAYNEYIKGLTPDERREQFGWLNKLSNKERGIFISKMTKSMKAWWNTSSDIQKQQIYTQRSITRSKTCNHLNSSDLNIIKDYYYYKLEVRRLTEQTYSKYKNIINPNGHKRSLGNRGYQLDHIFSISSGYLKKISPKIIASVHNLRIIRGKDNNIKQNNCDINKDELVRLYEEKQI